MSIKVSVSRNAYNVRQRIGRRINVSSKSGIAMARKLSDLQDVNIPNEELKDQYVLMYDKDTQKWESRNPDDVLSASAVTETTQPGLPLDFIEYLKQNLELDTAEELFTQLSDRITNLTLGDLANVNDEERKDKYIIMFNALLNEYRSANPDELLKAAVSEPEEPGLPDELLDQLDIDLDNRIDFDGGEY